MQIVTFLLLLTVLLHAVDQSGSTLRKMAEQQLKKNDQKSYDTYREKMIGVISDVNNNNRERVKILYLTSQSVPPEHFIKIAKEVLGTEMDVEIQPLMRGISGNIAVSSNGYANSLKFLTSIDQEKIREIGAPLKITPDMFEKLNIKSVPAIVVAKCASSKPTLQDCVIKFVAKGTTTLAAIAVHAGVGDSAKDLIVAAQENE